MSGSVRAPLVIGCGALANELVELTRRAGLPAMDLTCLPASLHNRPERIPEAVARKIRRARADGYDRIFVAYADCGTGGMLDRVLEAEGVARLEGAHCYEVYAGRAAFAQLADEEPGTFYLTDFLARNFDRLVIRGLGLDRHPELLPLYFGNYRRLVYLAQADDEALTDRAVSAATRLGLAFERRFVGFGELAPALANFAALASPDPPAQPPPAPVEIAPVEFAAPDRFAPDRFAPDRFAPDRFAPDRFAPDRFAPDRFAPDRFAPDRVTPQVRVRRGRRLRSASQVNFIPTANEKDQLDEAHVELIRRGYGPVESLPARYENDVAIYPAGGAT